MLKKILLVIFLLTIAILPQVVFAQTTSPFTLQFYNPNINLPRFDLITVIVNAIRWILGFLILFAVIMILYGGFVWMTSQGNPEKIGQAKKILKNTIAGLVVILLSYAIVSFVINFLVGKLWNEAGGGNPPSYDCPECGYLGAGILESHYPARNQKDVPRNTLIMVTFKEEMDVNTIISGAAVVDGVTQGDLISGEAGVQIYSNSLGATNALTAKRVQVLTRDKKTFVFRPLDLLGGDHSGDPLNSITVRLGSGISTQSGTLAFPSLTNYYAWSFETNGQLDLISPQVVSAELLPAADKWPDTKGAMILPQAAIASIAVNSSANLRIAQNPAFFWGLTENIKSEDGDNFLQGCQGVSATDVISIKFNANHSAADITWKNNPTYNTSSSFSNSYLLLKKDNANCRLAIPASDVNSLVGNDETLILNFYGPTINDRWHYGLWSSVSKTPFFTVSGLGNYYPATNSTAEVFIEGAAAKITWDNQPQTTVDIKNNIIDIGNGIKLTAESGSWANGNVVYFKFLPATAADSLTIADKIYVYGKDIAVSNDASVIIDSIVALVNRDLNTTVTALGLISSPSNFLLNGGRFNRNLATVPNQGSVSLQAVVKGSNGNSINATSTNSHALAVVKFHGGVDASQAYNIFDQSDSPRNSIVQITFNEAINPLSINSDFFKFLSTSTPANLSTSTPNYSFDKNSFKDIVGTLKQSNQYRTIEFVSTDACGVNSCGQTVYCLPAGGIFGELYSATLRTCSETLPCPGDYPSCVPIDSANVNSKKVCVKADGNTIYPQAQTIDGITDAAWNSLNGNIFTNDNKARVTGRGSCPVQLGSWHWPLSLPIFYEQIGQENNDRTIAAKDNFCWSFWVNDEIDLAAPIINKVDPEINSTSAGYYDPLKTFFSKIMRSATLKPGSGYKLDQKVCQSGTKFYNACTENNQCTDANGAHECNNTDPFGYLSFLNTTNQGVGYWISGVGYDSDNDGRINSTTAIINHTSLQSATRYGGQAENGVQDIYQNCYYPCSGPGCVLKEGTQNYWQDASRNDCPDCNN